jgi:hypothetical protein
MSNPLLSYAVSANQSPIQASPQTGDPSIVTLMIVVSNNTHQVIDCQSISFGFLQGSNAKDFFSDSTGIGTSAPTGWSIQQDGALFTVTPETADAGQIGATGLTFVLSNIQVNQQVGTTDMTITEVTSSNTGTLSYPLAKFPTEFAVGQLTANPVTVIQGESTTLSWTCSPGAVYVLQYLDVNGNQVVITETKDNQPLPAVGSYTIEKLQVNPTIIYLIVTLPVPGQNQPLVFNTWFPVSVSIPNVKINSFTASTQTVQCPGDEVTFTWDVTAATQVQFNGEVVDGNTSTIPVSASGLIMLQALGQGGPAISSIFITVSPVKINSFTATPSTVYGNNNNVPVTLSWDAPCASQFLVNDDLVTGSNTVVYVNETTSFTLEAAGYNGPAYAEIGVSVAPVNLVMSLTNNMLNISFNANPGTYTAFMMLAIVAYGSSHPIPVTVTQQTTTSNFGVVQLNQPVQQIVPFVRLLFVQLTLSGFPSGAIVSTYFPT